jgi:hypothetical protein
VMTVKLSLISSPLSLYFGPVNERVYSTAYVWFDQTRADDDTDLFPPSGRQVPQRFGSGVGLEVIRVVRLLSGTVEEEDRKD